ncbi:MAG: response regulator transcription factor [Defluviitaleaceae bacterium]|nr:response regulator transcription factor [Defluviitaleaceae bacterium]MCL2837042.1 response regulator transcription factor [Defluviitaleaceae bacterium]
MAKTVLIVEDEKKIADVIAYNLQKEGFNTIVAYNGQDGLDKALGQSPELVLLDIMMPELDGFQVCKKIREKSQVPIIMLTARVEEVDKVLGLELGADDYVTKPFSRRELMARIKANIRRADFLPSGEGPGSAMVFDELEIDLNKFEARRKNQPVDLTNKEFELLKFLASHPNKVFTREELLERVWGYEHYGDTRNVDVTVRRLRAKVEDNPAKPLYIVTKRDVGYYFSS